LILRKIVRIAATRCQIFKQKNTKFNFGWVSAPDPAGGAYSAPADPLRALLLRGRGGREEDREEREGGWKGEGREGKRGERGREFGPPQ